jgi:sulfide:quinone oxidoreductase
MKQMLILGGGTAGTMMANKLVRVLSPTQWQVTVLDRDDDHIYQPGLLMVPFGTYRPAQVVRPRRQFFSPAVRTVLSGIAQIDADKRHVTTGDGEVLPYDVLVVATGCRIAPEQVSGLTEDGWGQTAFDFYTLEGATALHRALQRFEGGKLVLNVAEMPIKCPVAPLEFLFLADAYFCERGNRSEVELVYATPLDGAFTKPKASALLGDLLTRKGIHVEPEFAIEAVDGKHKRIQSYDGRALDYDLLVSVPTHMGSDVVKECGLGDAMGFVPTDKHTLQSQAHPEIFVLGDATDLPTSKAGAVAHFQADVLIENLRRFIDDEPLVPDFDGHANCFIETGHGKAMLIDFNYETEPLPGRFPLPGIGPFTLLEESHVNHWGKLGFKWVYWNKLLSGDELPLDHRMMMAGKWS